MDVPVSPGIPPRYVSRPPQLFAVVQSPETMLRPHTRTQRRELQAASLKKTARAVSTHELKTTTPRVRMLQHPNTDSIHCIVSLLLTSASRFLIASAWASLAFRLFSSAKRACFSSSASSSAFSSCVSGRAQKRALAQARGEGIQVAQKSGGGIHQKGHGRRRDHSREVWAHLLPPQLIPPRVLCFAPQGLLQPCLLCPLPLNLHTTPLGLGARRGGMVRARWEERERRSGKG